MKEAKRNCCLESITCLDQHEDKVKTRFLFSLASLLLVVFAFYSWITPSTPVYSIPGTLSITIPPPSTQPINQNLGVTRNTEIIAYDTMKNQMPFINVTIEIQNIDVMDGPGTPACDTKQRRSNPGSLNAISLFQACHVDYPDNIQQTNEVGIADFPGIKVDRGIEGTYTYIYKTGNGVQSEIFSTYVESEVGYLDTLSRFVPSAEYGIPLSPAPIVCVLTPDRQPIKGKRVVAIAATESLFELDSFRLDLQANKFAQLSGDVSLPSDDNGIAVFPNLTVLASTNDRVFLVFCVDGVMEQSWPDELQDYIFEKPKNPVYTAPITMSNPGNVQSTILIAREPSLSVVEGEELANQPVIRLVNSLTGAPISGVGCIAYIDGKNEDVYPRGYRLSLKNESLKYLVKPVAGIYNADWQNPLADWLLDPSVTDSNGFLEFTGLYFSTIGNLGNSSANYSMHIRCGLSITTEYNITVYSRIASIYMKPLRQISLVLSHSTLYDTTTFLTFFDKNNAGVAGKIIDKIEFVNADSLIVETSAQIVDMGQVYFGLVSDSEGNLPVYIKVKYAPFGKYRIKITVDGQSVLSNVLSISLIETEKIYCGLMTLLTPSEIHINNSDNFDVAVKVLANTNQIPANPVFLEISLYNNLDKTTNLPIQLVSFIAPNNISSDSNGIVTFKSCHFNYGFQGSYYLTIAPTFGQDANSNVFCQLNQAIKVKLSNNRESFKIFSNVSRVFGQATINREENNTLSFQVLNFFGQPTVNTTFQLSTFIYQIAPEYSDFYSGQYFDTFPYIYFPNSTVTTNWEGNVSFIYQFKRQFPGTWYMGFLLSYIPICMFNFTTDAPVAKLEIVQQPVPNSGSDQPIWTVFQVPPLVKLTVDKGNLSNYTITAILIGVTNNDIGSFSYYANPGAGPDQMVSYWGSSNLYGITNNLGYALFDKLYATSIQGQRACFYIFFVFGEPALMIANVTSNKICFSNNFNQSIPVTYSTTNVAGFSFYSSITAIISVPNELINYIGTISFLIFPVSINGESITLQEENKLINKYAWNALCRAHSNSLYFTGTNCDVDIKKTNSSLDIYAKLTNFTWVRKSLNDKVVFRIGQILGGGYWSQNTIPIIITNIPTTLTIELQPPSSVAVGEIFLIIVKANSDSAMGIPNSLVTVNTTNYIDPTSSPYLLQAYINLLGKSHLSLGDLGQISIEAPAILDQDSSYATTDGSGRAVFSLKFISGIPQSCLLIFACNGIKSSATRFIQLNNSINNLTLYNSFPQTLYFDGDAFDQPLSLISLPQLSIYDNQGNLVKGHSQKITANIVLKDDILKAYQLFYNTSDSIDQVSLQDVQNAQCIDNSTSVLKKLKMLYTAIISPTDLFGGSCQLKDVVDIYEAQFIENDGLYTATSIKLKNVAEGIYYLIFTDSAIESKLTQEINIVMNNVNKSLFPISFEIVWSVFTAFIIIISNTVILNKYFSIFAFLVSLLEIIVVQQSNKGLPFQISSFIALGISMALFILTFYEEIKLENNAHFDSIRLKAFKEYTEYKMFGYKIQPWKRKDFWNYKSEDPKETSSALSSNAKVPTFKLSTMGQKIKSLFKPFSLSSTKFSEAPDCIYFPQRLLATLLLAVFVYVIISVKVVEFTFSFIDSLDSVVVHAKETIDIFLTSAITKSYDVFNYEIRQKDLQPYVNILDFFKNQLFVLKTAFSVSFSISYFFTILSSIFSFGVILYTFKKDALSFRRKHKKISKDLLEIDACSFPGNFIANSVITLIIMNIIYALIFTPFCHPLLWELIGQYWMIFVVVIVCAGIGASIYIILVNCVYAAKTSPVTRSTSHVFEILIFFSTVIGGVAASVGRVAVGTVMVVLCLIRIDKPVLPKWVLNYMYLDLHNKCYLSFVWLYCKYNNPVAVTFDEMILKSKEHPIIEFKKLRLLWLHKNAKLVKENRKIKLI